MAIKDICKNIDGKKGAVRQPYLHHKFWCIRGKTGQNLINTKLRNELFLKIMKEGDTSNDKHITDQSTEPAFESLLKFMYDEK